MSGLWVKRSVLSVMNERERILAARTCYFPADPLQCGVTAANSARSGEVDPPGARPTHRAPALSHAHTRATPPITNYTTPTRFSASFGVSVSFIRYHSICLYILVINYKFRRKATSVSTRTPTTVTINTACLRSSFRYRLFRNYQFFWMLTKPKLGMQGMLSPIL